MHVRDLVRVLPINVLFSKGSHAAEVAATRQRPSAKKVLRASDATAKQQCAARPHCERSRGCLWQQEFVGSSAATEGSPDCLDRQTLPPHPDRIAWRLSPTRRPSPLFHSSNVRCESSVSIARLPGMYCPACPKSFTSVGSDQRMLAVRHRLDCSVHGQAELKALCYYAVMRARPPHTEPRATAHNHSSLRPWPPDLL